MNDEKIRLAASKIVHMEIARRGSQVGNPDGYVRQRLPHVVAKFRDAMTVLLTENPDLTPDQLANLIAGNGRADPRGNQRAIALAHAEEGIAHMHEVLAEPMRHQEAKVGLAKAREVLDAVRQGG